MKTQIIVSALSFICMIPVQSQESKRKVQMTIIENGKVISDTTLAVKEDFDKKDIDRVGKMLSEKDVFVFRNGPGRNFAYSYQFNGFPGEDFDSLMRQNDMFFKEDSVFDAFSKRFQNDSSFVFGDFAEGRGMHFHRMPPFPHQRMMEEEMIFNDDQEMEDFDDHDVIIERKGPGKNQIIIKDYSGDTKTIHKRLDKDTDVIIIKKDPKKNKPEEHDSRRRDR